MTLIYKSIAGQIDIRVPIGQVDSSGYVYDSTAGQIDIRVAIGQVDSSGYVYDSTAGKIDIRVPIGQVDSSGYVYDSIAGKIDIRVPIGRVDSSGYVYDSIAGQIDIRVPIGQVKGSDYLKGGAALLLLLKHKLPTSRLKSTKENESKTSNNNTGIKVPGCFGCWPFSIVFGMLAIGLLALMIVNIVSVLTALIIIGMVGVALYLVYSIVTGFIESDNRPGLLKDTLKGLAIGASIGFGMVLILYSGFIFMPDEMNIPLEEMNLFMWVAPPIMMTSVGAIIGTIVGFFTSKN